MITYERVLDMVQQQEALEIRIGGEDWRDANHNYGLAIYLESAEVLEAYPWKWWKNVDAKPNWDKIAVELVDVWHFALASLLMGGRDTEAAATELHRVMGLAAEGLPSLDDLHFCSLASAMGCGLLNGDGFPIGNFIALCGMCDLGFDELYLLYSCKNVLNRFRQDRGYAKGLYVKTWGGREDNDVLMDLAKEMGDDMTSDRLYRELDARYKAVLH